MAENLHVRGARELRELIVSREVSAVEVVEALAERADRLQYLQAFSEVCVESALAQAEALDRALRRDAEPGPLHGVPVSVKANIDVAGTGTHNGIPVFAQLVPDLDAPLVERLRTAGAVVFARGNLPEFGLRWHTDNPLIGETLNPWDASKTPGGSSGGDACGVAAGMVPLGIGNDIGGSIRWPSFCCGVTGLKPTSGRVPHASVFEPRHPFLAAQVMMSHGPIARSVADLALALEVISGPHARDPLSMPIPSTGEQKESLRVGVVSRPLGAKPGDASSEGLRRALAALEDAGFESREVEVPNLEEVGELGVKMIASDLAGVWPLMRAVASDDLAAFVEAWLEEFAVDSAEAYSAMYTRRVELAAGWCELLSEVDALVSPVCLGEQPERRFDLGGRDLLETHLRSFPMLLPGNVFGLPATVVPTMVYRGLPTGVQVLGWRFREDAVLRISQAIEEGCGVFTPVESPRQPSDSAAASADSQGDAR